MNGLIHLIIQFIIYMVAIYWMRKPSKGDIQYADMKLELLTSIKNLSNEMKSELKEIRTLLSEKKNLSSKDK